MVKNKVGYNSLEQEIARLRELLTKVNYFLNDPDYQYSKDKIIEFTKLCDRIREVVKEE